MPTINASELERETGLSKDLLRKWRSRYGFPLPLSARSGYSPEQVAQLRLIRRLLDCGFRPQQVVGKTHQELTQLADATAGLVAEADEPSFTRDALALLKQYDLDGLDRLLGEKRAAQSLQDFIELTVGPLLVGLGQAWARGEIEVYHEHLCSNILIRRLYLEIASVSPKPGYPRILFATPSEELHVLGLLMAQAVLADQGAHCINVGPHIPARDLEMAAHACQAGIVALSFSFAYPKWRVRPILQNLREKLPATMEIWAGGAGAAFIKRAPRGVRIFSDLHAAALAVQHMAGQSARQADTGKAGPI
ncbi:MAG: MerR family transcriptional regulator [Azonexus sp.]